MPRKATPAPEMETLPRIDLPEDFSDVDGDLNTEFGLLNEDPAKHYVWVHNDPRSIGEYKGNVLKYQVEHAEEGGVRPQLDPGIDDGATIDKMDHVLMGCNKALYEKRLRFERTKDLNTRNAMFRKARSGGTVMRRGDDGRWAGSALSQGDD